MNEDRSREIQDIREIQRDLRGKLSALDQRIEQLEKLSVPQAFPGVAKEEVPPIKEITEPPVLVPPPLPVAEKPQSAPILPTPPITPQAEPKDADSLELRLGRVWLVRVGIVILLKGLVFLGNLAWTAVIAKLGAPGKLALIYLSGFGLGAIGWLVKRKRKELQSYGKVLIGGGIAAIYYATYAAYFVEPLRVIASPLLGGLLLMMLAGGIIWLADRMRSEGVAAATIVLGFYTAAINPIAGFSLFSNLVLSGMAIILLLRKQWLSVSLLSLIGCYLAYVFWRIHATDSLFLVRLNNPGLFWTALLFPACYWAVFTAATFLGRSGTFATATRSAFLTINNAAFFGLTSPLVAGTYPGQFWIFALIFGAILLGLSTLAARVDPEARGFDGSYLTQGLGLIAVAFLFKFSGYQLALVFALQSGFLMKLSRFRHGVILQIFSGLAALMAALVALKDVLFFGVHGEVTAVGVALILAATAWLFKFQRGFLQPASFQWRAAGYVALATVLGTADILKGADGDATIYLLLGLALLGTASPHLLRMPELAFGAQGVAATALMAWFVRPLADYTALPVCAATVLTFLALMHWWQGQRIFPLASFWRWFWPSLQSAALIAVVFAWTVVRFPQSASLLPFALCSLTLLTYALLTRSWPLAIGSQVFSLLVVRGLLLGLHDRIPGSVMLSTLVVFAAQSVAITRLSGPAPETGRPFVRQYNQILRALSVVLGLFIIQFYVPAEWLFLVFATSAFALFALAAWHRNAETLLYAAIAIVFGGHNFVLGNFAGHPVFAPDFAGLILILLAQQIGKRRFAGREVFDGSIQAALIIAGILGLWTMTGRMAADVQSGFLLTASWSLLAFVVLGAGFLLKERTYRILGLAILSAAIGRVFLIDVWQLETIFRILSFMVLGVVLLALGFLYNRFADVIRKWI